MMMIRRMTALAFVMLVTRMGLFAARDAAMIPACVESMASAAERMIDEAFRSLSEHDARRSEIDGIEEAVRHASFACCIRLAGIVATHVWHSMFGVAIVDSTFAPAGTSETPASDGQNPEFAKLDSLRRNTSRGTRNAPLFFQQAAPL